MTTVINNPGDNGGAAGWVFVIVIILLFVFFIYGLPALRGGAPANDSGSAQINVQLPSGDGEASGGGSAQ